MRIIFCQTTDPYQIRQSQADRPLHPLRGHELSQIEEIKSRRVLGVHYLLPYHTSDTCSNPSSPLRRFSTNALEQLKTLRQLEDLNLYYCGDGRLTSCVEDIAMNCRNLVSLNLGGIPLSRATIKCLADRCDQLLALNLCGTKLVDADLKHLARLKQLIALNISSNLELTNQGLRVLTEFTCLQKLDLFGIGRTEGFDESK